MVYGCAGSMGLADAGRRKKSVVQLRFKVKSRNRGLAAAMDASRTDIVPWSWKESTLLHHGVYEAYEFCSALCAPRSDTSRPNIPRKVDSKLSRRPSGLAVLRNHN